MKKKTHAARQKYDTKHLHVGAREVITITPLEIENRRALGPRGTVNEIVRRTPQDLKEPNSDDRGGAQCSRIPRVCNVSTYCHKL